jgi:hypothetical protein
MSKFDDFIKQVGDGIVNLANTSLSGYVDAATQDGKAFLTKSEADLQRWTDLLATGQLKPDEFKFLLEAKADVTELVALKQAGLAIVAAEKFLDGLIDLVVTTATKVFL